MFVVKEVVAMSDFLGSIASFANPLSEIGRLELKALAGSAALVVSVAFALAVVFRSLGL